MSDGLWDSMRWLVADRDAIDGTDPWDLGDWEVPDEITQTIKDFNKRTNYDPFHWLEPVCVCGADKAKTTHARWCEKFKEYK